MDTSTKAQIGNLLPPELAKLFLAARDAYLQADFKKALQLDMQVLDWADAHQQSPTEKRSVGFPS